MATNGVPAGTLLLLTALYAMTAPATSAALPAGPMSRNARPLGAAFAPSFAPAQPMALATSARPVCPVAVSRPVFGGLRMASHDDEDMSDDYPQDMDEVLVTDPDTKKTIECYIDQDVSIAGKPYYIVYPCDTPVVIAYVDNEGEEEELIPVSEEDLPRVFAGAYKACAELEAELVDSAVVLTLQGYEEDIDEDEELGDANEDEEFVRVITSYQENGVEYLITEPLEPVLIITKPDESTKGSSRQRLVCLPEDELVTVMPEVEKLMELRFQNEDDK